MSDELDKHKRRRKSRWGGRREGAGRKPFADKMYTLSLYLTLQENDAAHFLAVDRKLPISRCVGDLIMAAYWDRVRQVGKS